MTRSKPPPASALDRRDLADDQDFRHRLTILVAQHAADAALAATGSPIAGGARAFARRVLPDAETWAARLAPAVAARLEFDPASRPVNEPELIRVDTHPDTGADVEIWSNPEPRGLHQAVTDDAILEVVVALWPVLAEAG